MNDEKARKFGRYGGSESTRENREGSRICREPGSHSKITNPGLCPLDLRYTIRVEFLSGNPGVRTQRCVCAMRRSAAVRHRHFMSAGLHKRGRGKNDISVSLLIDGGAANDYDERKKIIAW